MTRTEKHRLATQIVHEWLRVQARERGVPDYLFDTLWQDVLYETPHPRTYVDLKKKMIELIEGNDAKRIYP